MASLSGGEQEAGHASVPDLLEFLSQLARLTLDANEQEIAAFEARNSSEHLQRFIDDPETCVIFVHKTPILEIGTTTTASSFDLSLESIEDEKVRYKYWIASELRSTSPRTSSLAIIKQVSILSREKSFQSQVQILNLPVRDSAETDTSAYESLHNLIKLAVAPYFDSFSRNSGIPDSGNELSDSSAQGVSLARKKLAELELTLLHLQQNVDLPPIVLLPHPLIQEAVKTAVADGRRPNINIFSDSKLIDDNATINSIQATTVIWRQQIKQATEKDRDPASGTASQEINFWSNLDTVLLDIEKQLRSDTAMLTFDLLAAAKRPGINAAMIIQDTGLKEAREKVKSYNLLMRDFPMSELLSAPNLERVAQAVDQIFEHLNRRLRTVPYPVARAIPLAEAITIDIEAQLLTHLRGKKLMLLDSQGFQGLLNEANKVFATYDGKIKDFITTSRDVLRKRSEKFLVVKVNAVHTKLQERLAYLFRFRQGHDQLSQTIAAILGANSPLWNVDTVRTEQMSSLDAVQEIARAYALIKDVDVLDVSPQGTVNWVAAERLYDDRIAGVELLVIDLLRERLENAGSANQMFRAFAIFNPLFVRPKIRGAVQEYQTQLIEGVKHDLQRLQEKFKLRYTTSNTFLVNKIRDVPNVCGQIIWIRQIERQLDSYMGKVETVLGTDWHLYAEGQKLYIDSVSFRKRLDVRPLYEHWLIETKSRQNAISGPVVSATRNRAYGNKLELVINFDEHAVTVFKEARNLLHLGFNIPHQIGAAAKIAKQVYPLAMLIINSNETMSELNDVMSTLASMETLVANFHNEVQSHFLDVSRLDWSFLRDETGRSRKAAQIISRWSNSVKQLQAKISVLGELKFSVEAELKLLLTCAFRFDDFQQSLRTLQTITDQLSLQGFANVVSWVDELNTVIRDLLCARVRRALQNWSSSFVKRSSDQSADQSAKQDADAQFTTFEQTTMIFALKNQVIQLEPPIDHLEAQYSQEIASLVEIATKLRKITADQFKAGDINDTDSPLHDQMLTFSSIHEDIEDELVSAREAYQSLIEDVKVYAEKWLHFQSLWDLQAEHLWSILGKDLTKWLQALTEVRKTRSTFDTSYARMNLCHIVLDFEQIQGRVNARYDSWQREIVLKFADVLCVQIKEFFDTIRKTRTELESHSLQFITTAGTVSLITTVQTCKRMMSSWTQKFALLQRGHATLHRHRYALDRDWLSTELVAEEWSALLDIFDRRAKLVEEQFDDLRLQIDAQSKLLRDKIASAASEWQLKRPVSGELDPNDALGFIQESKSRFAKLEDEMISLERAFEALGLTHVPSTILMTTLEEIRDFQSVWSAIATIWQGLAELKETAWTSVVPRKLKYSLELLVTVARKTPSRIRQYSAFQAIQDSVQSLVSTSALVGDLKADAMKERHWLQLFKKLKPSARFQVKTLTLGDVWALDLASNQPLIRELLTAAQGQLSLEEYLKEIRDHWSEYQLELVSYRNKCRLIRDWDELFSKTNEHLNGILAMRHSPFYKIFENEASSWEEKLTRVQNLFDVWLDVQRQWVYLESVFTGNTDIAQLLPVESSRFETINREFLSLTKELTVSRLVLDVINITDVQSICERLASMLTKIQKALGEYLERERSKFPRFYFLGDEDLLEMIGNSTDLLRVEKHLRKMFSGIHSLSKQAGDTRIDGFFSAEGEHVSLSQQISVSEFSGIKDWLRALETGMKQTLSECLAICITAFESLLQLENWTTASTLSWLDSHPSQILILSVQCVWTASTEYSLANNENGRSLEFWALKLTHIIEHLAAFVLQDLSRLQRSKCQNLIAELVHSRDAVQRLIAREVGDCEHFQWLSYMRFYFSRNKASPECVSVRIADTDLSYGFEYLGAAERLIQTPLTDRCYLAMTQALWQRCGGSPFGPAGTGKTETVKALGAQLGRFVLVFCCDTRFDYQSMGRIFLGLCQVGAWVCFDEFNRLEERMLSAVSQQIQTIQSGLASSSSEHPAEIDLVGKRLRLHSDTGIFITMNPGYAGRSELPDNLRKLFQSVAMSRPDKALIAEVTLYAQGFVGARKLVDQIVPFFDRCEQLMTKQTHYDFGLRALKSVLATCGNMKRQNNDSNIDANVDHSEALIVLRSVHETILPRLVDRDSDIFDTIIKDLFKGLEYVSTSDDAFHLALEKASHSLGLVLTDRFRLKLVQFKHLLSVHHGIMMVGPPGSGKSTTWKLLSKALYRVDSIEASIHIIDAKVLDKDALYGRLDNITREWTDGLFTNILRKIIDDLRGESQRRHWIIFDGDVDPDWVENMNSVLDDNKMLTLPNGERLSLPTNLHILFEVENLRYATLATVSRCGMICFNEGHVTNSQLLEHYLWQLQDNQVLDKSNFSIQIDASGAIHQANSAVVKILRTHFEGSGPVLKALSLANKYDHIMPFSNLRAITGLVALCTAVVQDIEHYNSNHSDFPLNQSQIEKYVITKLASNLLWALTGDASTTSRIDLSNCLQHELPAEWSGMLAGQSLSEYDISLPDSSCILWEKKVPRIEIDPGEISSHSLVIPTTDTLRYESIIYAWLSSHCPFILCGPPGSGKTMSLLNALKRLPNTVVASLNFSSATTPGLVLKALEQHCEYRKNRRGICLSPVQHGTWLVLFCDEINLPKQDSYGTQRVIFFLRQLIESKGFWRSSDRQWISLNRVHIVGACNPPTDVGRTELSERFLRHVPVLMIGYPTETSLKQIYGTFVRALLRLVPSLQAHADALTSAMIDMYQRSSTLFTAEAQSHYIYSPRELSRWVKGITEAIKGLETLKLQDLIRIWAHEAKRLFGDRLVTQNERDINDATIREVCGIHFDSVDAAVILKEPILYSDWLTKYYAPIDQEKMRSYIRARLKSFCEEETDIMIIPFDEAIEHVLQIDRVFKQPQGHLMLIGTSGSGKTTLCRFVAWINGMKTFQIKIHRKYSAQDFDEDLRNLLRLCGTKGERICFLLDESNVLQTEFLERMNTLLANAEIPGLFEGDELSALLNACREGAQKAGLILSSNAELYIWFTTQIVQNLHIVFTMNPPDNLESRAATSPALFNRCVLNWFGNWSELSLMQVAQEALSGIDLVETSPNFPADHHLSTEVTAGAMYHRDLIIRALVQIDCSVRDLTRRSSVNESSLHLSPRHFLELLHQFARLHKLKTSDLEDQQRHLNSGLKRIDATVEQVEELRQSLAKTRQQLEEKNTLANAKLQTMVAGQQEAELKKIASLEIQESLEVQEREIYDRRIIVDRDLAHAEPAVLEAQRSVSNIKKQQLTEVRSMANPPEAVKLAMESVCTLLGHQVEGWTSVQRIIRREDFIASIVRFDNETQMTPDLRAIMQNQYMTKALYQYESVNRASKACGPLVQWVVAQVSYSEILDRVGPLRAEMAELEQDAVLARKRALTMAEMIKELEESIEQYKNEYAELISETQTIKNEMNHVRTKLDRSERLLSSLEVEQERWQNGSKGFAGVLHALNGNAILCSAMLSYAGFFNENSRAALLTSWKNILRVAKIDFDDDQSLIHYLTSPDELLQWQNEGLPNDSVCIENAIILRDFMRYPLIIDPTERAVQWLLKHHARHKPIVTSFLDDSFLKLMETALRFGNTIIVNDAEYLDPILNRLLNREYTRTGGRTLVELGRHHIDVSPAFRLFLVTQDASKQFSPDICSRTNLVNFSITNASLINRSMQMLLESHRPEVEEKRVTMVKSQGEYKATLRKLEKQLLDSLNVGDGSIVDNEVVITTLERLKTESQQITSDIKRTEGVMAEIAQVTEEFQIVAIKCSEIFTMLDNLHVLNHFYRFSLHSFEDILSGVLTDCRVSDATKSVEDQIFSILRKLSSATFRRISLSMVHRDHIVLASLLSMILDTENLQIWKVILQRQIPNKVADVQSTVSNIVANVQAGDIRDAITGTVNDDTFASMLADKQMEQKIIDDARFKKIQASKRHCLAVLLMKEFRKDRLVPSLEQLASIMLDISQDSRLHSDLFRTIIDQVPAKQPIIFASAIGYDAAFQIEGMIANAAISAISVAMGSIESEALADRAITSAARTGDWVLLKNAHLAPAWLAHLEKKVHALKPHNEFRLCLTLEAGPKIGTNLLLMSRIFIFEAPPGIKDSMLEALRSMSSSSNIHMPVEKQRVYFLLAWMHSIVQERLRYGRIGWSKPYDFTDADFARSKQMIDSWIARTDGGRTNVSPNKIPWLAIQTLLSEVFYGGQIDTDVDQHALKQLTRNYFQSAVFDPDYQLVNNEEAQVLMPDVSTLQQFQAWVTELPDREPPSWLGLQNDAERLMLIDEGQRVLEAIKVVAVKARVLPND